MHGWSVSVGECDDVLPDEEAPMGAGGESELHPGGPALCAAELGLLSPAERSREGAWAANTAWTFLRSTYRKMICIYERERDVRLTRK